jgi:tensin
MEQKDGETAVNHEERLMGCAPYLQIFKAGKLIFTTAATLHVQQSDEELPFVQVMDGTVPFKIEEIIQGDILIRCRHLTFTKQRVSMFRAAFHTGYVPPNVLRLTKSQLDGACTDRRYQDDFFLDLIFEKVDAETATKHLEEQEEEEATADGEENGNQAKAKGPIVKAATYDTMLHGDSRFWDVITTRRQEQVKQKEEDPMWGKTVGRRRGESPKKENEGGDKGAKDGAPKERTQLETFSIGNEFDFLPVEPAPTEKPQKDSLMEALNALDEDEGPNTQHDDHPDTEEIVFETPAGDSTQKSSATTEPTAAFEDEGGNTSTQESQPSDSRTPETANEPAVSQASSGGDDLEEIEDMDALLSAADEDFGDLDLDGLDDDDDDLEDLENMLKT